MKALSGTGVARVVEEVELELPPPLEPVEPGAVVVPEPERVVPLAAVLVLDEVPVDVLVVERTVALLDAVAPDESAELELATEVPEVVGVWLPEESADVLEAVAETPLVDDAVINALPELAVVPVPAPDDDPPVLPAVDALVALVLDDWTYRSFSFAGVSWNRGSTSRMTWYWFTWVYIVFTWR
jgi:hypothetical protein